MSTSLLTSFYGCKRSIFVFCSTILLFLLFFASTSNAQLSGTYTICSGGSCNYSSINAAVTDLTSKGVSGPVTFNVSAGTYSEYITIPAITGASASNVITFKGAGRTSTILKGTSGTTVLSITGNYINFNSFGFANTSASGSTVSYTSANSCSLLNSNVVSASTGSANISCTNIGYISILNCYVIGGLYGLQNQGLGSASTIAPGNLIFANNRVTQFTSAGVYGSNTTAKEGPANIFNNNVFDSSGSAFGVDVISQNELGNVYSNNKLNAKVSFGFEILSPNITSSSAAFQVFNNWVTGFTNYGVYFNIASTGTGILFADNTVYSDSSQKTITSLYVINSSTSKAITIQSNILEQLSSTGSSSNGALTLTGSASGYFFIDGNDVIAPGLNYGYILNALYTDYSSYQKAMKLLGWEAKGTNLKPVYIKAPGNLHLDQTKPAPIGLYVITTDIDGDARCKLFPTAGADESNYDKGHQSVKIFQPSVIYPGSPTTIFQANKASEPIQFKWFINGAEVSDSVTLVTTAFITGVNTIKLVIIGCAGRDSFQTNDTIKAPTSAPVIDFLANFNKIKTGDVVSFSDLTSNGPTGWTWDISPATTGSSANYKYVSGSSSSQNPQVQFNAPGFYQVCLTAVNGVGSSGKVCKTNYITVYNYSNLGTGVVNHNASGLLFDDGGQNGNYISNGGLHSVLIDPCADSVFLTFNMFDIYCGNGSLQLYQGRDNKGKIIGNCTSGFTGGTTHNCAATCLPNLVKPDTFKAKNTMYIEMTDGVNPGAAGFAAFWWSTPKISKKASPSFTMSPTICVNQPVAFVNTTPYDVNDPATFKWDLDGDISTFECVGTCPTATESYFNFGTIKVSLIASNCAGTDTFTSNVVVKSPPAPKADFTVDNTTPTLNDIAFFTPNIAACVDNYKWTITKNSGTGTATFVNGTSDVSPNPQVTFSDVGYYDVKLYVDNLNGSQSNTITKIKYINVRNAYCIPHVVTQISDIGISKVKFNTIDNSTNAGAQEYTNFANTPSLATSVELGIGYNLTMKRDSPPINPIIRTAFIDWDEDGIFESYEVVGVDSNSTTATWVKKIKIPKTAKIGATIMRLAVNGNNATNLVCGINDLGEYQDYRLYITPYHTLPTITLKGHSGTQDTIYLEQGHSYLEQGYSAFSLLNGNITSLVKVGISSLPGVPYPGGLLYSYNVTDSGGLSALTQYRIVVFTKDITPPVLNVNGPDTTIQEVTSAPIIPYPVPSAKSALDLVDGNLLSSVVNDADSVKSNVLGLYKVTYMVTDNAGNTAKVYRYVRVIDTIAPVLVLKGKSVDTIAINTHYKDPGVLTSDNYYPSSILDTLVIVSSDLDSSKLGIYHITYYLKDPSKNEAKSVTRTIFVADKTAPVLTLLGKAADTMDVNTTYVDPGYTVTDNVDKLSNIKVTITGTFYSAFPTGFDTVANTKYYIVYSATDKAGNKGTVTRSVIALDRIAPKITLIGSPLVNICRWASYKDSGYVLSDNYDKNPQIIVKTVGTFITKGGTTLDGLYSIYYVATDRAGNKDSTVSRGINVLPANASTCINGIQPGLGLEKYISVYPNPNAGLFTIYLNLSEAQNIRISVTDMLGQEIQEIKNCALSQSNLNVDLSQKPNGVYFLRIMVGNEMYTKKVEVQK